MTGQTSLKVLFVDDEALIGDSAAKIFSYKGFDSRAVSSAEQALELFANWIPDIAVIDVKLPGMSGIDLAIRLKAESPTCRILLLSGFLDIGELLKPAKDAGHSFEVFTKPIQPAELLLLANELKQQAQPA